MIHGDLNKSISRCFNSISILSEQMKELAVQQKHTLERITDSIKLYDDHEARLRQIEKRIWTAAGIAAVAGSVLSSLIPFGGA